MRFKAYHKFSCFAVADTRVDRKKGIIYGAAIISEGEARGHDVQCDNKTLKTVMACAKEYKTGLKVKFNPDTFAHGKGGIVGHVPNASLRIEDGKLIGDIHVAANYAYREYLFELAENQADTFGLSIDFSGEPEEIGETKFARCDEIFAVTVVDEPAANATGLFSAENETEDDETTNKKENTNNTMALSKEDKEEFASLIGQAIKPVTDGLAKVAEDNKKLSTAFEKKMEDDKKKADEDAKNKKDDEGDEDPDDEELKAAGVTKGMSKKEVKAKVKAFREFANQPVTGAGLLQFFRSVGGRPAHASSGNTGEENKKQTFTEKRDELMEVGKLTKKEATALAITKFPKLYNAYRTGTSNMAAPKGEEEGEE